LSAGNNAATLPAVSGQIAEAAAVSTSSTQQPNVQAAVATPPPAAAATASALRGIASALLGSGGGWADARTAHVAAAVFSHGWAAAADAVTTAAHGGVLGSGYVPGEPVAPANPDRDPGPVPAPPGAALPWMADLLRPGVVAAAEPLLALQQFFPPPDGGEHDPASTLKRVLRSPWLPATAVTLVALEVLRRQVRAARESSAADLPGITGPRGL
jgi:hypothetical protein